MFFLPFQEVGSQGFWRDWSDDSDNWLLITSGTTQNQGWGCAHTCCCSCVLLVRHGLLMGECVERFLKLLSKMERNTDLVFIRVVLSCWYCFRQDNLPLESQLLEFLKRKYAPVKPGTRPVLNSSDQMVVSPGLDWLQVLKLDATEQILTSSTVVVYVSISSTFPILMGLWTQQSFLVPLGWYLSVLTKEWIDEYLIWDPTLFGGLDQITLQTGWIWTPCVKLHNKWVDKSLQIPCLFTTDFSLGSSTQCFSLTSVMMTMRWSTQTQWECLPLDMSCGTLMFSWNQPAM